MEKRAVGAGSQTPGAVPPRIARLGARFKRARTSIPARRARSRVVASRPAVRCPHGGCRPEPPRPFRDSRAGLERNGFGDGFCAFSTSG